jgi:TonB family protein
VTGGKRATVLGGGLSALLHLGLLAMLAGRPPTATIGDSRPSVVAIELETTTVEETPRPATPEAAPAETRSRGERPRPVSRRLPRVVVSVARESELAAPLAPHTGEPQEDEEAFEAEPEAPPPPAPIAEAPSTPTKAPVIAPETARALRVYDTFPMVLAQARLAHAQMLVEVCVSDHGRVSDAVISESSVRSMDSTLRTAIRSWRYRPLVVNGAPIPFCHRMRIHYAMN